MEDNRNFIRLQIEALAIRHYIFIYDELEQETKAFFTKRTSSISPENRELLFFLFAGIKSHQVSIEIDSASLTSAKAKYSKNECFSILTVNQIMKLQRKYNLLSELNFNIQSLNNKTTEYPFADCYIKLINMRNKLAHEMSHLTFQDTDIIEVLSNDYLSNHSATWFDSLDVSLMTDESKSIFSNFIIMNNMLTELRKRANLDDKTVDS